MRNTTLFRRPWLLSTFILLPALGLFLQKCLNNESVLSGAVSAKFYNREMKQVAAVLSPFG